MFPASNRQLFGGRLARGLLRNDWREAVLDTLPMLEPLCVRGERNHGDKASQLDRVRVEAESLIVNFRTGHQTPDIALPAVTLFLL